MNLYGGAEIAASDEPVNELCLGTETIVLDGGAFIAAPEADVLTLAPVSGGAAWSFSAKALKTLNRSGFNTLILMLNGEGTEIPTALEMRGAIYAKLSARGIVSKDYRIEVTEAGMEVAVAGARYRLDADFELVEIGG